MIKQLGMLSVTWLCSMVNPVVAQVTAPAPGDSTHQDSSALEEIVVTARHREENLETVPVAITAIGAARLREEQIRTEVDLQAGRARFSDPTKPKPDSVQLLHSRTVGGFILRFSARGSALHRRS